MEFNIAARPERFASIAAMFGQDVAGCTPLDGAARAIEAMRILAADLDLPKGLKEYGVREEHLDGLAAGVMKVTRLLANNPRELTLADARRIYAKAL
jgi:alcohol dehydrogenase class IV